MAASLPSGSTATSLAAAVQTELNAGRASKAVELAQAALLGHREFGPLWLLLGAALARVGALADADAALASACRLLPRQASAWQLRAELANLRGDMPAAVSYWTTAVTLTPKDPSPQFQLALALHQDGQTDAALAAYEAVVQLNDRIPEAWNNIASICLVRQDFDKAWTACHKALAIQPDLAPALHNYGILLDRKGDLQAAIDAYQRFLAQAAHHLEARRSLARLLAETGAKDAAIRIYEGICKDAPEDYTSHHLLAALRDAPPVAAPSAYVVDVFDRLAGEFDEHLVDNLGYRVPKDVAAWLMAHQDAPVFDLLDLGCGTGLLVRELVSAGAKVHATGVDLSSQMVATAIKSGRYAAVMCEEIHSALATLSVAGRSFDAVTLLDVLVYTGEPQRTLLALDPVIKRDGWLALSIETWTDAPAGQHYTLRPTGRFAHAPRALNDQLREYGFVQVEAIQGPIRLERGMAIEGAWMLYRRGG
jgi:predicted TPR repeat methyltransferase